MGQLLESCAEFRHIALGPARLVCLLSQPQLFLHGYPAAACIGLNRVQAPQPVKGLYQFLVAGATASLLEREDPEFLVFFDAACWATLDAVGRERLVYHELSHLIQKTDADGDLRFDDDGRPVLALIPHDYEFFDAEVRRYGPAVCRLDEAAIAIADGYRQAEAREKAKRPRRVA